MKEESQNNKTKPVDFIINEALLNKVSNLFEVLYKNHVNFQSCYIMLLELIKNANSVRSNILKNRDNEKFSNVNEPWFLSNKLCGMSLYVDRFCGNLITLKSKLPYFDDLGISLLHLMPMFQTPNNENDGGYAVSNFRVLNERFGTINDLKNLQQELITGGKYLMLDIVLNHTSNVHSWALKAKAGEKKYQDYFYFFDDKTLPEEYEKTMPEVFPEAAPGNFTFVPEIGKWVMTVFHSYQWDLNFTNPDVFIEMLDNIFFYANLGVDVLRIDAPAFIWKKLGTNCQNLNEAHNLLQLIKKCVEIATPGMALLAEAIVAPKEVMKYFGTGEYKAQESDFAYNATQMALQWDALATGNSKVMMAAQSLLLTKPYGTSWISYTRCHDDIGLAYDDYMIKEAGFDPYQHRSFLKKYYTGNAVGSLAKGSLFSENEKTGDARISGSLASLCGLEKAKELNDETAINQAINKIILMQAFSIFIGGLPMLYYGDELGYNNDYAFLNDKDKSYDNRWMHRPIMNWKNNENRNINNTLENKIFERTKKIISIRKQLHVIADKNNLTWLNTENSAVAGYLRAWDDERVYCIFNFSNTTTTIYWNVFKRNGKSPSSLYDLVTNKVFSVGNNFEFLTLAPYEFFIFDIK